MNVRVCGPNLRDQSKGTFHVHEATCGNLMHYGPTRPHGGDANGEREMLINVSDRIAVVEAVYADQLDESATDTAHDYLSDFWFAPCCKTLRQD